MDISRSLLALTFLLLGLCSAQETSPEIQSEDAKPTFSSRVNLVLVRVVVRDRSGKAIGTLQKDDFQLFDKGKPQVVSKFSIEKANRLDAHAEGGGKPGDDPGAPAVSVPDRYIAFLFDDVHLNFADLARVREAAGRQLDEVLKADTRVAIYTTSGQTSLEFTDDAAKVREAMLRIQPRTRRSPAGSECPDISFYMADLIQNRNDPTALSAATSEVMACGSMRPEERSSAEQMARSAASRSYNIGESETRLALGVLKDVLRHLAATPGQRNIVLVSPGFFVPNGQRFEESEVLDRAARNNVLISALDARGLYVLIPGGDSSQRQYTAESMQAKSQYDRDSASIEGDTLAELAYGAGGTLVHNTNDLQGGFQRVAAAPEYSYVLGFSPQNLKLDGSYHALKVSLKSGSGLSVQARRGYYAPRRAPNSDEQAQQEISEALFSREELQDIPVEVHTQYFKSGDFSARLSVLARVDAKHLRFKQEEGRNKDTLTVISALFDHNGNYITGTRKTIDMRLKDSTLESILRSGIMIKTSFDVTPGTYVVRVVLRDSGGETMAARNGAVEIP